MEASDVYGNRPLHLAAWKGHLEIIKALILKGADKNALSNADQSALGIARRYNHPEVFAFLSSLGAVDNGIRLPVVAVEDEIDEN